MNYSTEKTPDRSSTTPRLGEHHARGRSCKPFVLVLAGLAAISAACAAPVQDDDAETTDAYSKSARWTCSMTVSYRHGAHVSDSVKTMAEAEAITLDSCERGLSDCSVRCLNRGGTWQCSYHGFDKDYTRTVQTYTESEARAEACPRGAITCEVHSCTKVGGDSYSGYSSSSRPRGAACEHGYQCEGALQCIDRVCASPGDN